MGCLFFILNLFKPEDEKGLPYEKKHILSGNELTFYKLLKNSLSAEYSIFAKVRLEDIFNVRKGTENFQSWRGRIKSRHIDFVIMNDDIPEDVVLIEIDDSSHRSQKARDADGFKNRLANETGVTLIRIKAKRTYDQGDIKDILSALPHR